MLNPTPPFYERCLLTYSKYLGLHILFGETPHMQTSYVKLHSCGIGVGEGAVADGGVCRVDGEEGVSDVVSESGADPAGHEPDQRAPRETSCAGL